MVALPCEELRFEYTVSVLGRRRGTHTPGLNHFVELLKQGFLSLGSGLEESAREAPEKLKPPAAAPRGSPRPRRRPR